MLAFNLSAELVYTNVLNCLDLAGVPVRAADRTAAPPARRRRRPRHLQPRAAGRLPRLRRPRRRRGGRRRDQRGRRARGSRRPRRARSTSCGRWPGSRACTSPRLYEARYLPDGRLEATVPIDPAAPAVVEKRTIADLADWPYPKQQLVPLTEVVHDRLNVEVFRGCTRGCRFCQAGMITRPVRERPADQVALDDPAGPAPHRLRRGGAHQPVHRRLLGHRGRRGHRHGRLGRLRQRVGEPARACGSTPSPWAIAAQIQKARRTGLTFAPEAGTWRMRQVINKLITEEDLLRRGRLGVQPGLAAREALLPHRAPHRDRRGHPRHHRAGPALRRAGQGQRPQRHRSPSASAGFVPEGVHAVPVVRHEHRGRAAPQGEPAAATPPARPRACRSSGTTRGRASSRGS